VGIRGPAPWKGCRRSLPPAGERRHPFHGAGPLMPTLIVYAFLALCIGATMFAAGFLSLLVVAFAMRMLPGIGEQENPDYIEEQPAIERCPGCGREHRNCQGRVTSECMRLPFGFEEQLHEIFELPEVRR